MHGVSRCGVHDPIGAHFARIVNPHLYPGPSVAPQAQRVDAKAPLARILDGSGQGWHDATDDRGVNGRRIQSSMLKQRHHQRHDLVGRPTDVRSDAPGGGDLLVLKKAHDHVRIPYVDGQQHLFARLSSEAHCIWALPAFVPRPLLPGASWNPYLGHSLHWASRTRPRETHLEVADDDDRSTVRYR